VLVTNQVESDCLHAGLEVTVQAQAWDGRRLVAAWKTLDTDAVT